MLHSVTSGTRRIFLKDTCDLVSQKTVTRIPWKGLDGGSPRPEDAPIGLFLL